MDILELLARVRATLPSLWRENDAWTAERLVVRPPEVTRFRRDALVGGTRVRVTLEMISGPFLMEPHAHEGPIASELIDGRLTVNFGREENGVVRMTESRQISRDRADAGIAHAAASSYALCDRADAHGLWIGPPAVRVLTVVGPAWDDVAPPAPSEAKTLPAMTVTMERIAWTKILRNISYLD